jgi:type VI secretion system protein ImpK
MSPPIDRRAAVVAAPSNRDAAGNAPQTLVDLLHEGFYALFLIKNGSLPADAQALAKCMVSFLDDVDVKAKAQGIPLADLQTAKYAFCATVDEVALGLPEHQRNMWEQKTLQQRVCGNHHAGEHFYENLEDMRTRGRPHLQTLEVFQMCLLLGFKGKYALDGDDRISFLCARLGDEIARMRGTTRGFAPHALPPDQIAIKLSSGTPAWVLGAVFALAGLGAFVGFRTFLRHDTEQILARYHDVIKKMPARAANFTINLP